MLVTCPECQCKATIVESKTVPNSDVEVYCQCQNLNCSTTFSVAIEVVRVIDDTTN
ncbi:ogr/Delta-like zinc finger family protein [Vibrio metoecus]|uniref:ogr/Delta-like zinc finger family protein n=1 Tax=Vibrio metoecus TaxID=1481663 RepID=UPI0034DBDDD9